MKIISMFLEHRPSLIIGGLAALALMMVFAIIFACRRNCRMQVLQDILARLMADSEIFCRLELGKSDKWEDWVNWESKVKACSDFARKSLNLGIARYQNGQVYPIRISTCEGSFRRPGNLVADTLYDNLNWTSHYDEATCLWLRKVIWFYVRLSLILVPVGNKPPLVKLGRFDKEDDTKHLDDVSVPLGGMSAMELLYRDILSVSQDLIKSCPR